MDEAEKATEELARQTFLETVKAEGMKMFSKAQKKRVKAEDKVIYDANYKLLPEPEEETEAEVVKVVDVTPEKKKGIIPVKLCDKTKKILGIS